MKERKQLYKIGKKLGISEKDVKAAFLKNRNIIATFIIMGLASFLMKKIWFEPLHYTAASMTDFSFFTRFF